MALRLLSYGFVQSSFGRGGFVPKEIIVRRISIFHHVINEHIKIVSKHQLKLKERVGKLPLVLSEKERPLVLLFEWALANPKHVRKFVDFYLNKDFDVLTVSAPIWSDIWKKKPLQIRASAALEFLHENRNFQPLFVHCLSVGCSIYCFLLDEIAENLEKYLETVKRIKGHVWDSPLVEARFLQGLSIAAFPNNSLLQLPLANVSRFLPFFFNNMIKECGKARQIFGKPPFQIPSLLIMSKDDIVSPFDENMDDFEHWKSTGIKAYVKWWEKSPHVRHFHVHGQEYVESLNLFLDSIELNNLEGKKGY